jgi:hypothetical protein
MSNSMGFCKVQLDKRKLRLDFGPTLPLIGSLNDPGDGFPKTSSDIVRQAWPTVVMGLRQSWVNANEGQSERN